MTSRRRVISRGGLLVKTPDLTSNPVCVTIALWKPPFASTASMLIASIGGSLSIVSSIVADNEQPDVKVISGSSLSATNSFINYASTTLPSGTMTGCAKLTALSDNSGETQTVGLRADSPAIGAGANPQSLDFDQRGTFRGRQIIHGDADGAHLLRSALVDSHRDWSMK